MLSGLLIIALQILPSFVRESMIGMVEDEEAEHCNFYEIQTHRRFKRTLFIRTKHTMRIFGVILFIKLENDI